ncbi:hypothetical protein [Spirosoma endophyticum]|uniref:Uncharacterized protein n=1 Tax=Spirosoma endophyticum TaxID=662367 RepID=A0A1I2HXC9_9BACT|nr:hypothetical protein [Spirosoma endophyticum]SFF34020.1 hypothetical protein SAMN05216167_15014 [Spirosoma endophyticum]
MDTNELVGELLQSLIEEVKKLETKLDKLPNQTPPDYRASIDALTKAVQGLQDQAKSTAPGIDLSPLTSRLDRLEQAHRQSPERKMSQYLQVGAYGFGLMVVLLVTVTWQAWSLRRERSEFEVSDWKWRNLRQVDPIYVRKIDSTYTVSSQVNEGKELADFQQWIIQQEQADATRVAAQKAAEQAKAMNAQADQLEGKASTKKKASQ